MSWQEVSWSLSLMLLPRSLFPSFPTPAVSCVIRGSRCYMWTLFSPQPHYRQLPHGHPEAWKWSGRWCGLPSGGCTWKEASAGHRSRLGSFRQGALEPWAPRVWSRRGRAASGPACDLGSTDCLPGGEGRPEEGHSRSPLKRRDLDMWPSCQRMILAKFLVQWLKSFKNVCT